MCLAPATQPSATARVTPAVSAHMIMQPPFYANVDEQTLMNDCVRSSIANVTSYAQVVASGIGGCRA